MLLLPPLTKLPVCFGSDLKNAVFEKVEVNRQFDFVVAVLPANRTVLAPHCVADSYLKSKLMSLINKAWNKPRK
jgi:hypothetical protein